MKYIIFGTNRVAKDFRYIFNDLDILYHFKEKDEDNIFENILVRNVEYALDDKSYDKIIICDFDKMNKEKILQENGLKYGKHYIYEEDFFQQLDEIVIPKDKRIVIWGTGNICRIFLESCPDLQFDFFLDNYKKVDLFQDHPVYNPKEILKWDDLYIIIAVDRDKDIKNQLKAMGLHQGRDYVNYRRILTLPSIMIRKTIFDKSYYDLECNTMLNHLEILHDGNTRCCCTTFVKEDLDNIFETIDNIKDKTFISLRLWVNNQNTKYILNYINKRYHTNIESLQDNSKTKITSNLIIDTFHEFIWPDLNNNYYNEIGTCKGLIDHIGILSDGTIIPCCLDTTGIINLGNIYNEKINNILEKDIVKEMIDNFKKNHKCQELCKHCSFLQPKNNKHTNVK